MDVGKFHENDEVEALGQHFLVDFHWDTFPDSVKRATFVQSACQWAALAAGATVLSHHFHPFPSSGGLSGAVILAESHISIHTWPEHGYAALDVFMCGNTQPDVAVEVLATALNPDRVHVTKHHRGTKNE